MKLGTGTEVCETLLSFLIEFVPSYAWGVSSLRNWLRNTIYLFYYKIDKIIIECDDNQQKWIESALDNQWTIQFAPKELPKLITASKETHTGPTNTSNWGETLFSFIFSPCLPISFILKVIPGRLMAGAYPGSLNPGEHTKTVHSILKSKITTFVCLQEKEELGRFVPYKTIAKDHPNHVKFIHFPISGNNNQIKTCFIKNSPLNQRYEYNGWWISIAINNWFVVEINVYWWGNLCSLLGLYFFFSFFTAYWSTLLRRKGGHGRTGTIIATLIGFLYQVDAEAALDHTAATHKMRNPARSSSPQTASQFEQVRRLIGQFATLVPPIAHLGWAPK